MSETGETLEYSLSLKNTMGVVTLNGQLNQNSEDILHTCLEELKQATIKYIVLNFQGITAVDPQSFRPLVQFQTDLRNNKIHVKACNLNHSFKKQLVEEGGVIRTEEVFDDLVEALQTIMKEIA